MSARMPAETAITASAASNAVFSIQLEIWYPPPSCSAFHGRNGSRLCAVTTCGMPCSIFARCPAPFAYQVCECTMSAPETSSAICRSTPRVARAGFALAS